MDVVVKEEGAIEMEVLKSLLVTLLENRLRIPGVLVLKESPRTRSFIRPIIALIIVLDISIILTIRSRRRNTYLKLALEKKHIIKKRNYTRIL